MWDEVDGVKFLLDHIKELQINLLDGIDKVDSAVSVDLLLPSFRIVHADMLRLIGCVLVKKIINLLSHLLIRVVTH